ncbi:hypothetical protein [Tritonibacter mobilis]|uniref:hypothetical protein n=1 Tax=Tritonibacter mobilis TaxID=379347 RepID=UPI000806D42F|nr:hypothetical protein [Tritonibacter mobilis]GLP84576.1 hypothetical protein GCM10007921_01360 [Tritonibacter mobilis]SDW05089.1 hypothetical protein SAMN05444385_101136 [Tritonibacter mobilis]
MQIIIHAGAHGTEEDRLMKTLLRNKEDFLERGTSVPGPAKYRSLLKDCMLAAQMGEPSPDSRDFLWDAILEEETAERVILSNPHFFGSQRDALEGQRLYPEAEQRLMAMKALFPEDDLHLFMAIRSPVSFLSKLLEKAGNGRRQTVLNNTNPLDLRWSAMAARIRTAVPDVPITLWCYEDSPFLWAQILREMGDMKPDSKIRGGMDLLASIMTREGMRRLRQYLHERPEMTEVFKRKVFAAFLDKFALEEELEEELDIADWTPEFVEEIEQAYDADVAQLQKIPGVTLLTP